MSRILGFVNRLVIFSNTIDCIDISFISAKKNESWGFFLERKTTYLSFPKLDMVSPGSFALVPLIHLIHLPTSMFRKIWVYRVGGKIKLGLIGVVDRIGVRGGGRV